MHHILWEKHFGDLTCSHTVDDPPENNCPMHTHELLEMYYFISGNCTYIIEGTAYALKPHDILFKRPLEAHKLNTRFPTNGSAFPCRFRSFKASIRITRCFPPRSPDRWEPETALPKTTSATHFAPS